MLNNPAASEGYVAENGFPKVGYTIGARLRKRKKFVSTV